MSEESDKAKHEERQWLVAEERRMRQQRQSSAVRHRVVDDSWLMSTASFSSLTVAQSFAEGLSINFPPRLPRLDFKTTDRVVVCLDDNYNLHSFDNKPSIIYPDGRVEYHWRGVRVPDFVITDPSKITKEHINNEQNTEVRRVMLEKFGFANYLQKSKAKLIDEDEFGKLWAVPVPNDEPLVMVEVLNSTPEPDGSIKTYFLRVPPSTRTPAGGIAWTFGLEPKDYDPVFQS